MVPETRNPAPLPVRGLIEALCVCCLHEAASRTGWRGNKYEREKRSCRRAEGRGQEGVRGGGVLRHGGEINIALSACQLLRLKLPGAGMKAPASPACAFTIRMAWSGATGRIQVRHRLPALPARAGGLLYWFATRISVSLICKASGSRLPSVRCGWGILNAGL